MAKIIIVGSGAREHALAWSLSKHNHSVFVAPGNAGTHDDMFSLKDFNTDPVGTCVKLAPNLVIIGPEQPLVDGMADLINHNNVLCLGPSAEGARIESSKIYMKSLCDKAGVETAAYHICTSKSEIETALKEMTTAKVVVKADGLCGGKGVEIVLAEQALALAQEYLDGKWGAASKQIILEEFLEGKETSVIAVCSDGKMALLPPARDYKTLLDNNEGPNTGGMGAVVPAWPEGWDELEFAQHVEENIFTPILQQLPTYRGFLYAGLMINGSEIKVLEFNCRLGDPEAQSILMGLEYIDLYPLLKGAAEGHIPKWFVDLAWAAKPTITVVKCSKGYPTEPIEEQVITIHNYANPGKHFYAGVTKKSRMLLASGGRVVSSTASGDTLEEARTRAYESSNSISFIGQHNRTDIAKEFIVQK